MSTYSLPSQTLYYGITYKQNSNLISRYTVTDNNNTVTRTYGYDGLERVTTVTTQLNDGAVRQESYTYVSDSNSTSSLVATHTLDGVVYSYTYDDIGNITSVSENGTLRASYYYDSLGQLGQASYYSDRYYSEGYYDVYEYFYDKSGNITNAYHHYGIDAAYSDNVTYTYDNDTWGDLLTAYNGTAITYDTIGNPLKWRNATNIEWYGRQLSIFASPDGAFSCYGYNADGIRTSKTIYGADGNLAGTVKYTLDGSTIVAENRNGTNIYYTYDDKGAIMGMIYGGETYMFSKNLQGDVIGIYNENRQLVAKYQYDAYGEITAIADASGNDVSANSAHIANINPFRYRGYYYDTETGFYYLQTGYYDPVVGRFLSADGYVSTGQGIIGNNMFAYCNNNPILYIDTNGDFPWSPLKTMRSIRAIWNYIYNIVFEFDVLIDSQNTGNASLLKFGEYTSSYNGCGWIAIYNVRYLLGDSTHPANIIWELDNDLLFGGSFGVMPSQITDYFESHDYSVTTSSKIVISDSGRTVAAGDVGIMFVRKKGQMQLHYIAFKAKGKRGRVQRFLLYNAGNLDRVGLSRIKEKYDILKIWVIKNSDNNT